MEQHLPMTRRERHFLDYKTRYLEHYRVHYQSSLKGEGLWVKMANGTLEEEKFELVRTIMGNLVQAGAGNLRQTDLLKLAPYSDNEAALEIMAEIRAYYHSTSVAYIFTHNLMCGHAQQLRCSAISTRSPCSSIIYLFSS